MSAMASQITGVSIVCSKICLSADQKKHTNSVLLAFVRGIPRWQVDSPHKGPITRKMFSIWWRHQGGKMGGQIDFVWTRHIHIMCTGNRSQKLIPLQWRNNERDGVSNHQPHDFLLNRFFRSKKTSKFEATDLCVGNSPVTGEFPVTRKMFPFDDVIMQYKDVLPVLGLRLWR